MPLRGDQRALLQLLCERGQSYEDISGLLGVDPDEVQSRAQEALGDLGGADPDAEVGLTDYLLGQADPIGRADAVRFLQTDTDTLDLARRIEEELRSIAPDAVLPKLPESRGKRTKAAMAAPGESPPAPAPRRGAEPLAPTSDGSTGSNVRQSRIIAALVAIGVILLFAILAVAGVFSGGGDGSTASTSAASTTTSADGSTTTTGEASNITTVALSPSGGSGVGGTAKFGLVNNQQLYVDLDIQGLSPTQQKGTTNLAWLMIGPSGGYPINNPVDSPIIADANGNYSGRIAVPSAVALTVGGQATAVRISVSPIREIAAAAKQAAKQQAPILSFLGTELASGDIPLAQGSSAAPPAGGGTTPNGG